MRSHTTNHFGIDESSNDTSTERKADATLLDRVLKLKLFQESNRVDSRETGVHCFEFMYLAYVGSSRALK
jgi:hypothetical protein